MPSGVETLPIFLSAGSLGKNNELFEFEPMKVAVSTLVFANFYTNRFFGKLYPSCRNEFGLWSEW